MSFQNKYLNLKSLSGGVMMCKVINIINGKEYFYKTQYKFRDDVYTNY